MVRDVAAALRFFSRLPVPALPGEADPYAPPVLPRIAYAIPLAGAVIALLCGLVLLAARWAGLPPLICAGLAVTALVMATGAFHEDGLADTADGLGGGRTVEARLAILRDSRIGTYGGAALVLSLLLRVTALAALMDLVGPLRTVCVMVAAAAGSRAAGILLLQSLPAARTDGSGASAGVPGPDGMVGCLLAGGLVVALTLVPTVGVSAAFAGLIAPLLSWLFFHRLANRLIGGQTGDVAGATQQVAEIAILLGVLIFARVQ
ncbi:adenosylcobinamide-GDP ribazoletransferase [Aquabacter cavernae]|uniref:adenosylcobinamide-GDP ribazoletransferase n=1 Tax=Aquabacter cavernae TaxID=2496029 RepID=UPI000F8DE2F1|nr:adenosylcobinamide-GDP ribazoletransferase [Aquabacter cavernae]